MGYLEELQKQIDQAVSILREGGLIAFPTETYYGLGVDPFNTSALERLFAVKKRPNLKPVLVLVPDRDQVTGVAAAVPEVAVKLMDRFWPGPLTIVFPARNELSAMLTGGTGTIGVRLSPHPVALALLEAFGGPLTATSANRSGGNAAATEKEVREIFGNDVDMVLEGGRTSGLLPSTLIGFEDDEVTCIREGRIPFDEIRKAACHGS